jgi:rhodanese-related sulfurtransferase
VRAVAPGAGHLDDGDPRAGAAGGSGRPEPGGSRAQDDEVEGARISCHVGSLAHGPLRHDGAMHALPAAAPTEVADEPLLDVREDDEWTAGHAPQAVHVPLHELPDRLAEVQEWSAGRRLSVICRVGSRSAQATAFLLASGVDARNVDGGMLAWQAAGLPVVADTDAPRVV